MARLKDEMNDLIAGDINIESEPTPVPALSALRTAPTEEEVKAYWSSGRPQHIAKKLMEERQTLDAVTGASIYYIPEYDDKGTEKPAPTDLTTTTR